MSVEKHEDPRPYVEHHNAQVEYVELGSIKEATRNPKRHALAAIEASIARFGFVDPLIRDSRTKRLVSGHGRLEVLRAMEARGDEPPRGVYREADHGRWMVPILTGWASKDEADAEAFLLAVNRTVEAGGWSDADLGRVLADVRAKVDMTVLGFDRAAIARYVKAAQDAASAALSKTPEAPERPKDPTTKPGDLWLLGPHRLLCADSTKPEDVARLMSGTRARLVVTDPPYAIYGSSSGTSSSVTDDKIVRPFFRDVLAAAQASVELFAHVYVFCDWRSWPAWWEVARGTKLAPKNLLVWDKAGGLGSTWANAHELIGFFVAMPPQRTMTQAREKGMRLVGHPNVLRFNRPIGDDREHNAAKPVDLLSLLIEQGSDVGDLVLDLFAGSGSTLVAAAAAGRTCYTMDLDPGWCDVTRLRWERVTGQKATLAQA